MSNVVDLSGGGGWGGPLKYHNGSQGGRSRLAKKGRNIFLTHFSYDLMFKQIDLFNSMFFIWFCSYWFVQTILFTFWLCLVSPCNYHDNGVIISHDNFHDMETLIIIIRNKPFIIWTIKNGNQASKKRIWIFGSNISQETYEKQ